MGLLKSSVKVIGWGLLVAGSIIAPNPVSIGAVIAFAPDGLKGAAEIVNNIRK